MSKLFDWFFQKTLNKKKGELDEIGVTVHDPEKFNRHVKKMAKRDIVYTIVFILFILFVILKWMGVVQ